MKHFSAIIIAFTLLAAPPAGAGIVLAFDDGYENWIDVIAPELAEVGGTATAYVNNARLNGNGIEPAQLRRLNEEFGWEIATHTYHHYNAPRFVERKGLDAWVDEELTRSLSGLRELGFAPASLAFPFNSFDASLRKAALHHVASVRRREALPLAASRRPDGTIPAAAIDLSVYVPEKLVRQWIEHAAERDQHVFLFGHRVLPDSRFGSFTVRDVSTYTLTADREIDIDVGRGYGYETCLVPDTDRRMSDALKVRKVDGNTVQAGRGDLRDYTSVGKRFLVGPCYGTPLSEFRSLIRHAAERMPFLTVSEALGQ